KPHHSIVRSFCRHSGPDRRSARPRGSRRRWRRLRTRCSCTPASTTTSPCRSSRSFRPSSPIPHTTSQTRRVPPNPAYNTEVGSRPDAEELAIGEERLSALIERERPNAVVVRGDTNGTLSGARAAAAAGAPLVHIEAGLRSCREEMPEERNRVETDHLSDLLFPPTERAAARLRSEGVKGTIHVTGDPLCDMLESLRDEIRPASGDYVLANVDRD